MQRPLSSLHFHPVILTVVQIVGIYGDADMEMRP